jgi:hypothetical protein
MRCKKNFVSYGMFLYFAEQLAKKFLSMTKKILQHQPQGKPHTSKNFTAQQLL